MNEATTKLMGISAFLSSVFAIIAEDWFKIGGFAVSLATFTMFAFQVINNARLRQAEFNETKIHNASVRQIMQDKNGG